MGEDGRNQAPRGSLLQISRPFHFLEYAGQRKVLQIKLMSTKDIKIFQSLQNWPKILRQEGQAKALDVIKYLTQLRKRSTQQNPQYFVTGWVEGGYE